MQMGDSRLQYVVTVALLYMTVCVSDSTCDLLKCYCTRGGVVPCLADNTCEINTAGTVEGGSIIHQRCRAFLDLETNTIQYDCVKFGGKSLFSGSSTCSNKQKINIVSCCFNETLCNRYLPLSSIPTSEAPTTVPLVTSAPQAPQLSTAIVIAVCIIGVSFIVISLGIAFYCHSRQKNLESSLKPTPLTDAVSNGHTTPTGADGDSSGKGMVELEIRTIYREFERQVKISTGRYGDMYKASWRGSDVTIKTFQLKDEEAFKWEKGLYWIYGLRHSHLVGCIAADTMARGPVTQQWLVTTYHAKGTLLDFLRGDHPEFNFAIACQFGSSIANGLAYLHSAVAGAKRSARAPKPMTNFLGTGTKPSIAHCALSSDVILIKDDMTCCLSDLTMATQLACDSNEILHTQPVLSKAGEYRYMAPELLDDRLNRELFETFRQLDMYSYALLLWEIIWCCPIDGRRHGHQLPFDGIIPSDACLADWRHLVSTLHIRPPVLEEWKNDKIVWSYTNLMKSCWNSHANGRRTALNATKALQVCYKDHMIENMAEPIAPEPANLAVEAVPPMPTCFEVVETSI